jgi:hypothetical protein
MSSLRNHKIWGGFLSCGKITEFDWKVIGRKKRCIYQRTINNSLDVHLRAEPRSLSLGRIVYLHRNYLK